MASETSDGVDAIHFLVGSSARQVAGFIWRIGWQRTSFYLTPTWRPMSALKVSLHGPDDEHEGSTFLVGNDAGALPGAVAAGGRGIGPRHRKRFTGRQVAPGVVHAVTIRTTWDLFVRGVPSGPPPQELRRRSFGGIIEPPGLLKAVDVELFVCEGEPYWPDEEKARADNACLGPLRSKSGHSLTAVVYHRDVLWRKPPLDDHPVPLLPQDRVRGIATAVDPDGHLCVVERWLHAGLVEEPQRIGLPLAQWIDGPSALKVRGRSRAVASVKKPTA